MDPFSIVALIFDVLNIVGRIAKCVQKVKEAYDSKTGLPKRQESLLGYNEEMIELFEKIQANSEKFERLKDLSKGNDKDIEIIVTQCQNISSKIASLIIRDKPERPHSIKGAIKATTKLIFNKSKLRDLEVDLGRGKERLNLALASSMKTQIGQIINMMENSSVENKNVQQQLEEIQSKMSSANNNLHEQFQQVLSLCRRAQEIRKLDEVFRELSEYHKEGTQLNPRYNEVHENLIDTFEWIYDDPQRLFEVEPDLKVSFADWLREGEGIFHILGKPGAGKSTLMKFIWKHKITKDMLNIWAGTSQLLCLKYFFWPTSHQDGLTGLRCSFLKSALEQAPELMELLIPGHDSLDSKTRVRLSYEEISQATDLLISSPLVLEKYRIFLLIDGLDEFDEMKHAEDHHDLVRLIQSWTFLSAGRVKICVSSREYEAFMSVSLRQKIRLHNLTRQDIQTYVMEGLEKHSNFPKLRKGFSQLQNGLCESRTSHTCTIECLVAHIVDIAEGIFLWTRLAMIQLRKFLSSDYDPHSVWNYVDARPKPLLDYLKHMLDSISPSHKKEAFALFGLINAFASISYQGHVSILGASYLAEKLSQAAKGSSYPRSDSIDFELQRDDWHILTEEQINARFNGLIQISEARNAPYEPPVLTFAHRSVFEILKNDTSKKNIECDINKEELANLACQLVFGEVILSHKQLVDLEIRQYGLGKIRYLAYLIKTLNISGGATIEEKLDQIEDTYLTLQFGTLCPTLTEFWSPCSMFPQRHVRDYRGSILIEASHIGLVEILPWIMKRMNRFPKRGALVSSVVLSCMRRLDIGRLRSGPDNIMLLAEFLRNEFIGSELRDAEARAQISTHGYHTTIPWVALVGDTMLRWEEDTNRWTMMEQWLCHRANPRIQLRCFRKGATRIVPGASIAHETSVTINGQKVSQFSESMIWGGTASMFINKYLGKPVTLRDFVMLSNAHNKQRLLELIDSGTALLEADEAADVTSPSKAPVALNGSEDQPNDTLRKGKKAKWHAKCLGICNVSLGALHYHIVLMAVTLLLSYLITAWGSWSCSNYPGASKMDSHITHDL
ncbi:uncharacterized protein F4812DRAFT_427711 [Daldinia caldariorum]|uniref:uncharacterized protein n=1 Tax=Daldinia caldariorum TaxID=326644 RepID=UPI0020085E56|nr:uncharacterized protein F4812DRAFT_427711 [Daldinia caldariorum]KAI1467827.1 hypothetical protein F4812DRAFT_427711 [Daldinia caldariorum]